jgi:hypothetical protein
MAHWRRNHESKASNDLHSYDLYDEARSTRDAPAYFAPVVLIERMTVSKVVSADKPKGERRNFAHFKGKAKPLALNVTNCKSIESLAGSPDPAHWVGTVVQLVVDQHAKYPGGKTGPAIRIAPKRPTAAPDTAPLPEISAEARERLEAEHEQRIDDGREPGEEG